MIGRLPVTTAERAPNAHTNVLSKVRGKPFQKGPDARRGVSSGRPTDDFMALMRGLASNAETFVQLTGILSDKDHVHFMRALVYVTDRGYGRATLPIDLTSNGESLADVLRRGRDRVARMRDADPDGVQ